jgi:Ca-activated chloride channel family protein
VSELLSRLAHLLSFPIGEATVEFAAPWALLLLPLPLLAFALLPPYKEVQAAVRIPFFERMARALDVRPQRGAAVLRRTWLQRLLGPVLWVLLVAAAARPELVLPPIQKTESTRDLLIAADLSESMDERDYADAHGRKIGRLDAVKQVVDEFIARRPSDRIGLVLFGEAPYLQAPFTLDHAVVRQLLAESRVGMAGPRTMIGDAIGLSIKLFAKSPAKQKVVILMTDGNDTGSKVPPGQAAQIAKDRGITIHTIGIGDPATKGQDIVKVGTLRKIAEQTGGSYFLAMNREELEGIYEKLDEIEKIAIETQSYRPRRPLFVWPLGAAALLLAGFYALMGAGTAVRRAFAPRASA